RRDGLHGELPGLQRVHADSNPDTGVSNFLSAPPALLENVLSCTFVFLEGLQQAKIAQFPNPGPPSLHRAEIVFDKKISPFRLRVWRWRGCGKNYRRIADFLTDWKC
ncbi:MAG: hypothetical protein KHW77_03050, partial [Adlercreutzia equolifaciens]|nr:hypothetical protein [Adlercreutzia equolifaciens]